jgi:tRNA A37 threonylcarbamoyladenosine dehydratase
MTRSRKFADYVVDCIDSIAPKVALIVVSVQAGTILISSMGEGQFSRYHGFPF